MLIKAKQLEQRMPGIYELAGYLTALLESRISMPADLNLALNSQHSKPHPVFKQQLTYWLSRLQLKPVDELKTEYLGHCRRVEAFK